MTLKVGRNDHAGADQARTISCAASTTTALTAESAAPVLYFWVCLPIHLGYSDPSLPPGMKNKLAQRFLNLAQPVGFLEDFAGFGTVGCAYYAVLLHQVNQVGGAAITDAQAPLQQ